MISSLQVTDDLSKSVQKTSNRVSLESIEKEIDSIEFHNPSICPHMTVAYVKLKNGFIVIGKSTPADPENYDSKLCNQFARDDALRQVWPLLAFRLRDFMTAPKDPPAEVASAT